ncbi:hypothetical protein CYY_004904 [Polysphondylium violaceum]|uniref:AN1-type domain-containing protein n=1 Tax=Polysphondylium violaceum TaxID=133409 RepID=A0A8J4UYY4_9MYCE|nr:hypothetical protein CYY_004904 [Polysphondylium violaceum]
MDFPQLGAHCAVKDCNLLDYLPFECDFCHLKFCLDHKDAENHKCPNYFSNGNTTFTHPCPICTRLISISNFHSIDEAISAHIDAGCKEPVKLKYDCKFSNCTSKEFIKIVCNLCNENFCLKHRFPSDHGCHSMNSRNNTINDTNQKPIKSTAPKPTLAPSAPNKKQGPSDKDLHNESKKQLDELKRLREERKGQYTSERQKGEIIIIQTNGARISHVFGQYDSLRSVQLFINQSRTDGSQAYAVLPETSNKPYEVEDLSKSLDELNLYPHGTLRMINFNSNSNNPSYGNNSNNGGGLFSYISSFFR